MIEPTSKICSYQFKSKERIMANHLLLETKTTILQSLVEGSSIRSISRLTGASKNTIAKLLIEAGDHARDILDTKMMGLQCQRVQVDEIWTFVQKKQKRIKPGDSPEFGDQYVFVAMDADTKLVPCFRVAKRDGKVARSFMMELATRASTRFQLSTDSFAPYYDAVDRVFGEDVDYAQIHKELVVGQLEKGAQRLQRCNELHSPIVRTKRGG